jgi:hypothetical protein
MVEFGILVEQRGVMVFKVLVDEFMSIAAASLSAPTISTKRSSTVGDLVDRVPTTIALDVERGGL